MTYRYPGGLVRRTAANTAITGASGVWDLGSQAQAVKNNTWPISGLANPVSGSLRFRASNTSFLTRTFGAPTNNKVWTWSAWVKRGSLSLADANHLFLGSPTDIGGNPTSYTRLIFETDHTLRLQSNASAGELFTSSAVYRDSSAWYHIVLYMDAVNTTVRCYVNGVEITYASRTNPSNQNTAINGSGNYHRMGLFRSAETRCFDGYMAEVNFIDGQALTPSYFGQTSAITGVWEPIKYTGTYGNNGFYLSLSDTSSIGKDFSGNGDNWTPNNFSTANDSTFDLMRDVPTQYTPQGATDVGGVVRGNYCVLNPLIIPTIGGTKSNGNLLVTSNASTYAYFALPTMFVTSGKWYAEVVMQSGVGCIIGIVPQNPPFSGNYIGAAAGCGTGMYQDGRMFNYDNAGGIQTGLSTFTTGTVVGVALDMDDDIMNIYINGTILATGRANNNCVTYSLKAVSSNWSITFGNNATYTTSINYGQRPFTYTPPSGFKSLCTTNLPTPTIGATAATAANKYMNTTLYTGNNSTQSVTGVGFQPDFVWIKERDAAEDHFLFDAVRGATKFIRSNTTDAEGTLANYLTAFNSDGFSLGDGGGVNGASDLYVSWNWNAGGSTVTNTSGSISAQVRASTTAGFSVVTYTGNGTGGATIGHGLGAAPSMLMFKNRDETGGNSILVWHTGFNTNQGQMLLSSTAAIYNPGNGLYFNSTTPGASVVTLGTSGNTNPSAQNMVMYAWTPIAGFSAFGSYTGNGSTDGTFVYTGFRPRFVLIKRTDSVENWAIFDTSRIGYNADNNELQPNTSTAEGTADFIDILSNGFKNRNSDGRCNASGGTYIYAAFAEAPFKNSLAR
jgi:hypothetical protein